MPREIQVGDIVKFTRTGHSLTGLEGKVTEIMGCQCHLGVQFKGDTYSQRVFREYIELVEEANKPDKRILFVKIENQQQWNDVEKKCFDMGREWNGVDNPTWRSSVAGILPYGERAGDGIMYSCCGDHKAELHRIITTQEFLKESVKKPDPAKSEPPANPLPNPYDPKPALYFGDTPSDLGYPPDPKKQAEKVDSNHCKFCRCDNRLEHHHKTCKNYRGGDISKAPFAKKTYKTLSDKPENFDNWFEKATRNLIF